MLHPFTTRPQECAPSTQDLIGDTNVRTSAAPEMTPAEAEEYFEMTRGEGESQIQANIDEFNIYDAHHCRECGEVASGSIMGGTHVQLCDECILCYVMTHITPGINVAALA